MALYELSRDSIKPVDESSFAALGVLERSHLQRLLRDSIGVIAPDTLIITEEFGEWLDSSRRIDLLGIDRSANLVVIELKRNEDGGHMELQALRYSAMVSTMTFGKLVEVHQRYLDRMGRTEINAERNVLDFLDWDSPEEEKFADDVRIVLASADFSKELTTTVMWLNERDLDIRCVRLRPYKLGDRILLDVQQIIPLPEVTEYQVRLREKATERRLSRRQGEGRDFTRYDLECGGKRYVSQAKRHMMFEVVRSAVAHGAKPSELPVPARKWLSVEGRAPTQADFEAKLAASASDRTYARNRWFSDTDRLMFVGDRTYCLSNQWGSSTLPTIEQIGSRYPELGIRFTPTTDAKDSEEGED